MCMLPRKHPFPGSHAPDAPGIVQIKVWLFGIKPIIWRRTPVTHSRILRRPYRKIQIRVLTHSAMEVGGGSNTWGLPYFHGFIPA